MIKANIKFMLTCGIFSIALACNAANVKIDDVQVVQRGRRASLTSLQTIDLRDRDAAEFVDAVKLQVALAYEMFEAGRYEVAGPIFRSLFETSGSLPNWLRKAYGAKGACCYYKFKDFVEAAQLYGASAILFENETIDQANWRMAREPWGPVDERKLQVSFAYESFYKGSYEIAGPIFKELFDSSYDQPIEIQRFFCLRAATCYAKSKNLDRDTAICLSNICSADGLLRERFQRAMVLSSGTVKLS